VGSRSGLPESGNGWAIMRTRPNDSVGMTCLSNTQHGGGLLRPRRKRPRCRAAEQPDELAPVHSITSSARASTDDGLSMRSALAGLRLLPTPYLVGAGTGRPPASPPGRIG